MVEEGYQASLTWHQGAFFCSANHLNYLRFFAGKHTIALLHPALLRTLVSLELTLVVGNQSVLPGWLRASVPGAVVSQLIRQLQRKPICGACRAHLTCIGER